MADAATATYFSLKSPTKAVILPVHAVVRSTLVSNSACKFSVLDFNIGASFGPTPPIASLHREIASSIAALTSSENTRSNASATIAIARFIASSHLSTHRLAARLHRSGPSAYATAHPVTAPAMKYPRSPIFGVIIVDLALVALAALSVVALAPPSVVGVVVPPSALVAVSLARVHAAATPSLALALGARVTASATVRAESDARPNIASTYDATLGSDLRA